MFDELVINKISKYLMYKDAHYLHRINMKFYLEFKEYRYLKRLLMRKINVFCGYDHKDIFSKNLIDIVDSRKELSFGGLIILDTINDGDYDSRSTVDIFCEFNVKDDHMIYTEPYLFLEKFLYKNNFKHNNYITTRDHASIVKNYAVRVFTNVEFYKINIIETNYSPLERINTIKDLTFLNNFYHNKRFYISNIDCVLNKVGIFENYDNIEKIIYDYCYYLFGIIYWRFYKYHNKGYKIFVSQKSLLKLVLHNNAYTLVKEKDRTQIYQSRRVANELVNFDTSCKCGDYFVYIPNPISKY